MRVEPEQLLHPHRQDRPLLGSVIDRDLRAGRYLEMGRCLRVEAPLQVPGQEAAKSLAQEVGPDVREPAPADEMGRKPLLDGRRQRLVRQVRPFIALRMAQEHDTFAPLRQRLGEGQQADA